MTRHPSTPPRRLTGRHVLAIAVAAFGTIIAANLTMLFAATGTFPGLVVQNAYVASQGWDKRLHAQRALGWTATVHWANGLLAVDLRDARGEPVAGAALEALVGRPTLAAEDRTLAFVSDRNGYHAPADLNPGAWRVELRTAEGPAYTVVREILVPETP